MRTLLFIVIIGNLLLLGLILTPDLKEQQELPLPPLPPGVKPLQLLSERTEQPPPPTIAVEERSGQPVTADSAAAGQDGADTDMAPEAMPDIEAPSELAATASPPPPALPQPACHTVGPFASKQDAAELIERLAAQGAKTAWRQSEIQEPAGYWVYLPSMERSAAEKIVAELVANKVQDYFLGPQNYISLGIYSGQETAQERMQQITDMGYTPKLEQRFKIRDVYWLDVEEPEATLTRADWAGLLAATAGVRQQDLACE